MNTRSLLGLTLLLAVISPLAGGCGVGTTENDTNRKISRVIYYDQRELVDDVMLFMQTNRPLRTDRWIID